MGDIEGLMARVKDLNMDEDKKEMDKAERRCVLQTRRANGST